MSEGNFECLGTDGIFEGIRIVTGWPGSLSTLVSNITSARVVHGGGWKSCMGPLFRHLDQKAPASPFRNLMRELVPEIVRDLNVPIKHLPGSTILGKKRTGALTTTEVVQQLGIDRRTLKGLVGTGESFLSQHPGSSGARLFDGDKLRDAIMTARRAPRVSEFVQKLGLPLHCAPAFVDAGIVNPLDHPDAQVLAGKDQLLMIEDVQSILCLPSRLTDEGSDKQSTPLTSLLQKELNPAVWVSAFKGIDQGEIKAWRVRSDGPVITALLVDERDFRIATAAARQEALPAIVLSGCAAKPMMGVSESFLWAAARAGYIRITNGGLALTSLADFQATYVVPSEIAASTKRGKLQFKRTAKQRGIEPVAAFLKTNIWLRADVEQILAESPILKFATI